MGGARLGPGDLIAGRFELEAAIGSGGMGNVFRARDRERNEAVAVKLLRHDEDVDAERFRREATLLASLSHPGIVRYVAHGRAEDGSLFLAMEWLRGETLARRLAGDGLDVAESLRVLRGAAAALGEAHAKGIVHRDIKPANLLFADGELERVKVIDFGVAKGGAEARRLTRTGTTMGTPGYMAPEQARGRRVLDGRVDVFALGCVLWECLTGYPAFSGEHDLAVQAKILLCHTPPLRDLCPEAPEELEALLGRALAKDPVRRVADGAELASRLAEIRPPASSTRRPVGASLKVATRRVTPLTRPDRGALAFTVIAATASALEGGALDEPAPDLAAMGALLAQTAAAIEILGDGSVVALVVAEGEPQEGSARAARLALALKEGLPGRRVVVAASRASAPSIDEATRVLHTSALAALFGAAADAEAIDAVQVDELTAGHLDARFEVRRGPSGCALHGVRG